MDLLGLGPFVNQVSSDFHATSLSGELNGVRLQIDQDLLDPLLVRHYFVNSSRYAVLGWDYFVRQTKLFCVGCLLLDIDYLVDGFFQVKWSFVLLEFLSLYL